MGVGVVIGHNSLMRIIAESTTSTRISPIRQIFADLLVMGFDARKEALRGVSETAEKEYLGTFPLVMRGGWGRRGGLKWGMTDMLGLYILSY